MVYRHAHSTPADAGGSNGAPAGIGELAEGPEEGETRRRKGAEGAMRGRLSACGFVGILIPARFTPQT